MNDMRQSNDADVVIRSIPELRAYARALLGRSDGADALVQDTLVTAIAEAASFPPRASLRVWLFTIMRRTVLSPGRNRRMASGRWEPASANDGAGEIAAGLSAIERLPERCREVFVLVAVLGVSREDAAVICNCTVSTVKSRLNRARKLVLNEVGTGGLQDMPPSGPTAESQPSSGSGTSFPANRF